MTRDLTPDRARPGTLFALAGSIVFACSTPTTAPVPGPTPARIEALLATVQQRTFAFFWERSSPETGLTPDRWPTPSFSSIAAVGFALTAYPVGAEAGYVTRDAAAQRTLATLRFFWQLPQGPAAAGTGGYPGFFFYFFGQSTRLRYPTVGLSTVAHALPLAGVFSGQHSFARSAGPDPAIRAYADSLSRRTDWTWAQPRPPLVTMGWTPESGFHQLAWRAYDEAFVVYPPARGPPPPPIAPEASPAWASTYQWGTYY